MNSLVLGGLGLAGGYALANAFSHRPQYGGYGGYGGNYGNSYDNYGSGYGGNYGGGGFSSGYPTTSAFYPSYGRHAVAGPEKRIGPLTAGGLGLLAGAALSGPSHLAPYPYGLYPAGYNYYENYGYGLPHHHHFYGRQAAQLPIPIDAAALFPADNAAAFPLSPPEGRVTPLLAGGLGLAAGYYLANRYERQPYFYQPNNNYVELPASTTTTVTNYPGYEFQQPTYASLYRPGYGKE